MVISWHYANEKFQACIVQKRTGKDTNRGQLNLLITEETILQLKEMNQ